MKDMIMVLGLLVILVLIVDRMISRMPGMLFPEETADNTKRVMVDDVLFLQKIRKYIKPSDYTVFTGHSGKLLKAELKRYFCLGKMLIIMAKDLVVQMPQRLILVIY